MTTFTKQHAKENNQALKLALDFLTDYQEEIAHLESFHYKHQAGEATWDELDEAIAKAFIKIRSSNRREK